MERVFECNLFGESCRFLFSGNVLFDARDKYGMELNEIMELKGREKLGALCYLATEMSKEAGDDKYYKPEEIDWQKALALETAVLMAINKGTWREHPSKEPRSKTLEKIQKKTASESHALAFIFRLLQFLGLRRKKPCAPPRESSTT